MLENTLLSELSLNLFPCVNLTHFELPRLSSLVTVYSLPVCSINYIWTQTQLNLSLPLFLWKFNRALVKLYFDSLAKGAAQTQSSAVNHCYFLAANSSWKMSELWDCQSKSVFFHYVPDAFVLMWWKCPHNDRKIVSVSTLLSNVLTNPLTLPYAWLHVHRAVSQ